MEFYAPISVFYFFILVGLVFIPVFVYVIYNFKFNLMGWCFVLLSFGSYLFVGEYIRGSFSFSFANEHSSTLGIGFFELILLSYSYIFIGLSVLLGKKGVRNKN